MQDVSVPEADTPQGGLMKPGWCLDPALALPCPRWGALGKSLHLAPWVLAFP